ncbi:MAG: phospholipase A [Proteobacteria bacterium]|nr:phospholipase A [Pseudomonadota bacterium]MBU1543992.1 phospholipase A [Pseudomonadota bacterium]MBU2429581.1 phospholipase A [Pseudomonadota bacterium]MBU2480857.1 phospholipase A [Pseudomonadota bacterium]
MATVLKQPFLIVILSLFSFFMVQPALAQDMKVFIVPPQAEVLAGQMARFILFFQNPDNKAMNTGIDNRIMVTIEKNEKRIVIEAMPTDLNTDAGLTIPANGYMKREYQFLVPQTMDGYIRLYLEAFNAGPVLMAVKEMPIKDRIEQIAIGEKQATVHPLVKYLSPYEPMYFLAGVDPGLQKSKFQISLKYKIFNYPKKNGGTAHFLNGIHAAYTQTSFWDLNSDSAPFDDTSYKPELFYLIPKINLGIPWIKAFGLQSGYKHESNGKDEEDSRSTNFLYIEPIMGFSTGNTSFLKIAPRIWTYFNNNNGTNEDLDLYRGYFNVQITAGDIDGFVLDTNTRWADKGSSFQADLSYPLHTFENEFSFYLHLQYFNGYAENLLHYKDKDEIVRLGISIVR